MVRRDLSFPLEQRDPRGAARDGIRPSLTEAANDYKLDRRAG